MNGQTPCEYARERHQMMVRWRNIWTALLIIAGATVVLFVIAAILLLLLGKMPLGVVAAVASLIDGVALAWVVQRQREAVADEESAYADVVKHCGKADDADSLRGRTRFKIF